MVANHTTSAAKFYMHGMQWTFGWGFFWVFLVLSPCVPKDIAPGRSRPQPEDV